MACHSPQQDNQQVLPADVERRIAQHPCYSEGAHQFARIHLPVAPACNIQCNYCNRKYDCSNESRPGVVSRLLSPAEGVDRLQTVLKRVPETRVVGIAGPGDPLANPKATLATLSAVKRLGLSLHLCVSTNGLNLPEYVEPLAELGVEHLTVTLNTLDPKVGAKIYPWIYHDHRRIRGEEAAEVLLSRQIEGIKQAVSAGMLLKINSVLIPGVNDQQIPGIAKLAEQEGAFLHNIMPLISDPAHGTYFGLTGQNGPDEEELQSARKSAGISMRQMSHCQQCRADAVGRLGDDRSAELSAKADSSSELKVAVATSNGKLVDQHFGHAQRFAIYQLTPSGVIKQEERSVDQYCLGASECDSEADNSHDRLGNLVELLSDCQQVLCARIGLGPWQTLESRGIKPVTDYAMLSVTHSLDQLLLEWQQSTTAKPEKCKGGLA